MALGLVRLAPWRVRSWTPAMLLVALAVGGGCARRRDTRLPIQTSAVVRRTIISEATASGAVEPINVIEVKSKSSGQISAMTVETGSQVKKGDLLVQLDTRDVKNQYDQAKADLDAAQAKLTVSSLQLKRNRDLAAQRVITAQELEAQLLDSTNAASAVVRARTNLDLADQRLADATVRAPSDGTIITKTVSLGQVIASATSSASGGTMLLTMANLSTVRVRANFNETDIANVHPGQDATLTVDAYPDRPFRGTVEKIEPQAVVVQSVTFFPVLVRLDNVEGLLKPGMNGEVSVLVDTRENVLAVENDAVRTTREAVTTAKLLGMNPDSVQQAVQEQTRALLSAGFNGGVNGGANGASTGGDSTARVDGRSERGQTGRRMESRGEVALDATAPGQGEQQPGGRRGGFGNLPQVTDEDCAKVRATFAKHPQAQQALQSLRERAQGAETDFQRMRTISDSIYKTLGIEANVARACQFRDRQQAGSGGGFTQRGESRGAGSGARPSAGSDQQGERRNAQGGTPRATGTAGAQDQPMRVGEFPMRSRARPALVYVAQGTGYVPRVIRAGLSDLDYTEVVAGLQEGERVVLLAAVQLQAQRDSASARLKNMQGLPGMQKGGNIPGGAPGGFPGGGPTGGRRPGS